MCGMEHQFDSGNRFLCEKWTVGGGAPAVTNTFVGRVIANISSSVTNQLGLGYTLQGSPIPYAGNLAIIGQAGGDTNMDFGDSGGQWSLRF